MNGKLFVVEGATASGKDTLLGRLSADGLTVMRGVPSQNPLENSSLLPGSQEIIGDTVFNFREALSKPAEERVAMIKKFIAVSKLQQDEALRRKQEGETIFLNRSVISLIALFRIPVALSDPEKRDEIARFTDHILVEPIQMRSDLLSELDGIVWMQDASVGGKEREGMAGIQRIEATNIAEQIRAIDSIPVVELNANLLSPEEERERVKNELLS